MFISLDSLPKEEREILVAQEAQTTPLWKICSHCRYPKPLDHFYNKSRGKFGKQEQCKRCMAKKSLDPELAAWARLGIPYPVDMNVISAKVSQETSVTETGTQGRSDMATSTYGAGMDENTVLSPTEVSEQPVTGTVNFANWLRDANSVAFVTSRVCVIKRAHQGSIAYDIYGNTGMNIFLPQTHITESSMCEFVIRAIYGNLEGPNTIEGVSYK